MTDSEKKQLFTRLFDERRAKEGRGWPTRFARSLNVSLRTVLNWRDPKMGWTSADQEEAVFRYFDWKLDERGDPVPAHNDEQKAQTLVDYRWFFEGIDQVQQALDILKAKVEKRRSEQ